MYYALMKIFLGIMIGIITLIGTSKGEVGESIQQIKNKQGPLEKVTDELLRTNRNNDQASYPNKQIFSVISDILMQYQDLNAYIVKKPKNFDAIIYFFFNNKDISLGTCVLTTYLKFYKPRQGKVLEIGISENKSNKIVNVNEVEAILTTNSSCFSKNTKIIYSENVKNGIGYAPWRMQWSCLGGQIVDASVGDCGNFGYLKLFCISKELVDFSQEQEKQKNNDGLPEGIWDIPDYNKNTFTNATNEFEQKNYNISRNINKTVIQTKNNAAKILREAIDQAKDINPFRFSIGQESEFATQQTNGGVLITKYQGNTVDLIIPDKLNGVNVVEIGQEAFKKQPIRNIRLPAYLKRIEPKAFYMCKDLQSVSFNEQIEEIGNYAFSGCNLGRLQLPSNISRIGSCAFSGNRTMRAVTISSPFVGGHELFGHCHLLSEVSLPEGMTNIPSGLFANCYSLKRVRLPEGVNTIGNSAFLCAGLEQVPWPNGIQHVEPAAFASCTNLTSVTIPSSVTNINGLFQLCRNLEKVNFPESLKEVGWSAFRECEKLKNITFNGIKIDEWALAESGVEKVIIINCEEIERGAFAHCQKLVSITLGERLKKIGAYAFRDCQSLTSITIPASVILVEEGAFEECKELAVVKILGNKTKIMPSAFKGCINLKNHLLRSE